MSDAGVEEPAPPTETEATGETVGEARWSALRELERRFPGLDKRSVEVVVLSEGQRGLLGVGFEPARVLARVVGRLPDAPSAADEPSSESATLLQELLEAVRRALGVDASVTVREEQGGLLATFHGRDLGLLIGKHGQTIDAVQYLASAVLSRGVAERVEVVVDAAGYRERRRATLESLADRTASRVAATGRSEQLEPMSAVERKVVHLRLADRADVVTASDGAEPSRRVVISPASED